MCLTGAATTRCARHRRSIGSAGRNRADPGDGRRCQVHAEEMCHEFGQPLLGQQLVVQQIQHDRADALAVPTGAATPSGKAAGVCVPASHATAAVCAVLRDEQRLRFVDIEHLPGNMVCRHRRGQRLADVVQAGG